MMANTVGVGAGISGMSLYVPSWRVPLEAWCGWTNGQLDKIRAVVNALMEHGAVTVLYEDAKRDLTAHPLPHGGAADRGALRRVQGVLHVPAADADVPTRPDALRPRGHRCDVLDVLRCTHPGSDDDHPFRGSHDCGGRRLL